MQRHPYKGQGWDVYFVMTKGAEGSIEATTSLVDTQLSRSPGNQCVGALVIELWVHHRLRHAAADDPRVSDDGPLLRDRRAILIAATHSDHLTCRACARVAVKRVARMACEGG